MIYESIYDLFYTYLFNSTLPYTDLLCTLASGASCLAIIYFMFLPIALLLKALVNFIFN